jgi:CRISPR-associated endoribonuclease Cas6
MPFSILIQAYPQADVQAIHVQGPALRGMFLHLIRDVDEATCQRLYDDSAYRPYTLSPLGLGEPDATFDGFRLLRSDYLCAGTPCYLRLTLLEDHLFPTFSRYFLDRVNPTFRLGGNRVWHHECHRYRNTAAFLECVFAISRVN